MLLTDAQMKHLSKGVNESSFVFNDNAAVTEAERRWLMEMDEYWFEQEGYHFIDNYRELYRTEASKEKRATLRSPKAAVA